MRESRVKVSITKVSMKREYGDTGVERKAQVAGVIEGVPPPQLLLLLGEGA